ncbi:putative 26S proteasome regulatory subunit RPN3 [Cryptosporidium felis]|nr:putative 26S proteasome regulatory subunit RPN3 [Cryptosporidium felis]
MESNQEVSKKESLNEKQNIDSFTQQLISSLELIRRGVEVTDQRLIGRALRVCSLKRCIKKRYIVSVLNGLKKLIETESHSTNLMMVNSILFYLDLQMFKDEDVAMSDDNEKERDEDKKTMQIIEKVDWNSMRQCLREGITLIGLIVLTRMYNVSKEAYILEKEKSMDLKRERFQDCLKLSKCLFEFCKKNVTQTMDQLFSKVLYFYSRVHEICGEFVNIKNEILECYRNSALNHTSMTQASCINLILRNYVLTNRCDLGLKVLENMVYPDNLSSGIQQARYLFYSGRIYSAQLEYQMAYSSFSQSLRKTPQTKGRGSLNFTLLAQKFAIVVQLLMGEIPERSLFNTPSLRKGLDPYLELVKAVRSGDMKEFDLNIEKRGFIYKRDGTLSLVKRLAHNVIRSGLKTICSSYSRIYLDDIADYFGWDNSHDVEGVVTKAIFDKVVEAKINDDIKCVETKQRHESYGSESMLNSLHSRIAFCLLLRSNTIKAMEYPQNISSKNEFDGDEEARRLTQEEIEAAVNSVDDGML